MSERKKRTKISTLDEKFSLRLDIDLKESAKVAAERSKKSLGRWIRDCIEDRLRKEPSFFEDTANESAQHRLSGSHQ